MDENDRENRQSEERLEKPGQSREQADSDPTAPPCRPIERSPVEQQAERHEAGKPGVHAAIADAVIFEKGAIGQQECARHRAGFRGDQPGAEPCSADDREHAEKRRPGAILHLKAGDQVVCRGGKPHVERRFTKIRGRGTRAECQPFAGRADLIGADRVERLIPFNPVPAQIRKRHPRRRDGEDQAVKEGASRRHREHRPQMDAYGKSVPHFGQHPPARISRPAM